MRRALAVILSVLLLSACTAVEPALAQIQETRYEVVFEVGAGQNPMLHAGYVVDALGIIDGRDGESDDRINHYYTHTIRGFSMWLTAYEVERANRLFDDADLLGIRSITLSETFSVPIITTLSIASGEPLADVQLATPGLIRVGPPDTTAEVDIAIIDTGIAYDHPELNVVGGKDCTGTQPRDRTIPAWNDDHGHGTHVAGITAARDNGIGIVGVAPGARLHAVKVLGAGGSGSTASVICGIDYVASLGTTIDVANMSLGGRGSVTTCGGPDPMHNAMCVLTDLTTVVVAAGNSSQDVSGASPANYPEVVTVSAYTDYDGLPGGYGLMPALGCAAMSIDDELAAFSNYGEGVDIAAPGVCILSTLPGGTYGYASGTSMAAPFMTGCVARYISDNPDQRMDAVDQILMWSASRTSDLRGDHDQWAEPILTCANVPRYVGG